MYGWIWRKLPLGLPGKIIGTLVLVGGVIALLWFVVFPAVDPILPFNNVQVSQEPTPKATGPAAPPAHTGGAGSSPTGGGLPGN